VTYREVTVEKTRGLALTISWTQEDRLTEGWDSDESPLPT